MSRPSLLAGAAALLAASAGAARADGIAGTAHNLSVSGPGPVKAAAESQICVFCHTPHDASPAGPLWNHRLSAGVTYLKYTSPTMVAYTSQAAAPDPDGASKLCLSCHDGSVALGAVQSRTAAIPLQGGKTQLVPGDPGYLGTDLSRTHPISFVVTDQLVAANNAANGPSMALAPVATMRSDPDVHLDALDRVQCTSCHDAHSDANYSTSGVHFYRKAQRSQPCQVCHLAPPADLGPHAVRALAAAPAAVPGALQAAPARVLDGLGSGGAVHGPDSLPMGCMSCHLGHASGEGRSGLLLGRDEQACFRCHGPGSALEQRAGRLAPGARPTDLAVEFQKPSHHPVELPGDHRPDERLPETDPNARRHVRCVDCHDAHGTLGRAPPEAGSRRRPASTRRFATEAEMCLLCHGAAANRPAGQPDVARQLAAASRHPVLGPGSATRVPSLLPPLTTASIISCSDCHGNDDPLGPRGPHGSIYPPLLVRNDAREDLQPESPARYALCYGCHDRSSILSDASFPLHREHVVDQRTPCSACHSAHGSESPALVDFDPSVVKPNARGLRTFTSLGSAGGQCALSCHGANHDPASYCGPGLRCATPQAPARAPARPALAPVPAPQSLFPGWPGE